MAVGRTFAAMKDYSLDGNREMVALGTMNIVGSLTFEENRIDTGPNWKTN